MTNDFEFEYKEGTKHKISEILTEKDIFLGEDFGKPIITKSGIQKLKKHFNFKTIGYDINWDKDYNMFDHTKKRDNEWKTEKTCLGTICTVIVTMTMIDSDYHFLGDGESNFLNTLGIAREYMLAMAIKRAESRAILSELGIDAYGEDESHEFESKVEQGKDIKRFLSIKIKELAEELGMEQNKLRKFVAKVLGLDEKTELTIDVSHEDGLMDTLYILHERVLILRSAKSNKKEA